MSFGKYNVLTTEEQILALDEHLTELKPQMISVDTETNGLHFWKNLVIGISLSTDSKSGFYIPFLTWKADESSKKTIKIDKMKTEVFEHGCFECIWTGDSYPENVTPQQYKYPKFILDVLKKHLLEARPQLIMHNAPFDVLMIETSLGFNLEELVFVDTLLLKHAIDENTPNGLKDTAILWSKALGIPVEEQANKEQLETKASVIRNGGEYKKTKKTLWRCALDIFAKYAIADTFLTYGIFEVGTEKLMNEYEPRHFDWFFEDEVMPLCREVIIPMKRKGVRIDVDYFVEMEKETQEKLDELEDLIAVEIAPHIKDFDVGTSVEEAASRRSLVEFFIEREGLTYPQKFDKKKGTHKNSLAKAEVKKAFTETNHWLWAYLLGEAELNFTKEELDGFKVEIFRKKIGRRYHFNISSDAHLRWLFCDKLGANKKELPQTDSATKDNPIPSMKAEVLKQFFLKKYSFVKPLLLFKKLKKLHSTYILPALELHNNGFLHMDFKQAGTISGRLACGGGFNLQTLPRLEELNKCYKCGSKSIIVINPIRLVAVMGCEDCGHEETDIVCPSAIKAGFIAPEGYKIVNADYSSLEPRCFAFVSGETKIKDIYLKNLDFYSKFYCDMEDQKGEYSAEPKAPNFLKKLAPEKRVYIKPVALGIPYGARGPQTAKLMNFKKTIRDRKTGKEIEVLDVERGKAFREKYLNTYPRLRAYMERQDALACKQGFVETLVGRRRHFKFTVEVFKILDRAGIELEEFLDCNRKILDTQHVDDEHLTIHALKKLSERCGFAMKDEKKKIPRTWSFVRAMFKNELNNSKNMPIQGLGAHVANRGMIEMTRAYKAAGLDSFICLQVHDEVTSYAKIEQTEETVKLKKIAMETNMYAKLVDIPMIADPLIANNLKEAK